MEWWKIALICSPALVGAGFGFLALLRGNKNRKTLVDHIKEHRCIGITTIHGDGTTTWHPNERQPDGTYKKSEYQLQREAEERAVN